MKIYIVYAADKTINSAKLNLVTLNFTGRLKKIKAGERIKTTENRTPEPWERQENESPQSFGAFAEYRDMGADRSIPKVAQKCTKNESLIKRWSAANGWVKRAEAWDNEQDRLTREKLTKGVTGMRKKYVDICAAATLKIAQALKNVNIERNSFKDITAALKIIMEIERINRGEPAEITEIAGERNFGEPKFSIRRKTDYSRLSDEEVERLYEIAEKLNST